MMRRTTANRSAPRALPIFASLLGLTVAAAALSACSSKEAASPATDAGGASASDGVAADATPTDATPTDATPTDATPTDTADTPVAADTAEIADSAGDSAQATPTDATPGDTSDPAHPAVSAEIGPDGGELSLTCGARLLVPAGALSETLTLTARCIDPWEDPRFAPLGPFYQFEPEGLSFSTPATLEAPLDATGDGEVGILWRSDGVSWAFLQAVPTDDGASIRATIRHFSQGGPATLVAPCEEDADCPNGGEPYCDGGERARYQCIPDAGVCARESTDCAADGMVCVEGACQAPCATDADCPNGGSPVCEDTMRVAHHCAPDTGECVRVPFNCAAQGDICVEGACVGTCKQNSDCPGGGYSTCEGGNKISNKCVTATGKCEQTTVDCAAQGKVCMGGGCATACKTTADCTGGGSWYCQGTSQARQWCSQSTGACVKLSGNCAKQGGTCSGGKCVAACQSNADCTGGGDWYCAGSFQVRQMCSLGTGVCVTLAGNCAQGGQTCSGGKCVDRCTSATECANGGQKYCIGTRVAIDACHTVSGKCLTFWTADCATTGKACANGACAGGCASDADCPNGGKPTCEGTSVVEQTCDTTTGGCAKVAVADCAAQGQTCAGGACAAKPGACTCDTPGATFTPETPCGWGDEDACSGFASAYCGQTTTTDAEFETCSSQVHDGTITFPSGTKSCGFGCCITIGCP